VAIYRDQGQIAAKTSGFEDAGNVATALPIIRTPADHGTAFDLASQDKASPGKVKHAIMLTG
jgi:4-hydroxy-L-threonine phosphate dehydrogenase PdxA